METFLEILKYILPSLVVVLVVWLMLRKGWQTKLNAAILNCVSKPLTK